MAKARKTVRGRARKKVRKRAPVRRAVAGRKQGMKAKAKATTKRRRRAKAQKEGPIESALHAVVDTVQEAGALRRKLAGRETFED
jgi:hypothetical protein